MKIPPLSCKWCPTQEIVRHNNVEGEVTRIGLGRHDTCLWAFYPTGEILHTLLPGRRTERVGWCRERRKRVLGGVSKGGRLVVAWLRWERVIKPFHLRDDRVGHPHEVPVGALHCIFAIIPLCCCKGELKFSHDDETLLLELLRCKSVRKLRRLLR